MSSSEQKNWFIPILVISLLTTGLGLLYFISPEFFKAKNAQERREFDYSGRPVQTMTTTGQIILRKNERHFIGRNCLVFKGLEKKTIIIDLYVLELDPEQAFEKRFLKKDAKKEMVLGDGKYRLISVNNQNLILKSLQKESTP